MYHSKHKNGNTLAVVILVLVSVVFRFAFSVSHIAFGQDIARDNWLIEERIINKQLIVDYGPKASVGNFYLPPLYYQLHVFFSLISNNDPLTMKWVVTFVEAFSPVLLFLLLKKIFSQPIALLTSFVYVVAPIPLQYGTTAWNPNMIPFLSLLLIYAGIQIITLRKLWYIPIACIVTISAFQFHYQSAVLLPFLLFVFIYSVKKFNSRRLVTYWLFGLLLMLISLLPYVVAEFNNHFQNSQAIFTYFTQEHAQYFERVSKPTYLFTYFPKFFDRVLFGKESFHSIFGLCLYFGGIYLLFHQYRHTKKMEYMIILVYFVSIFLMLRVFKGDKLDYYLSTLYCMPFLLLATICNRIQSKFVITSIFGLLFFALGIHLSQWQTYDDLSGLRQSMAYIQERAPMKSVRILFHDDDFVNTVFYGFKKFTTIKLDPSSSTAIDICNTKDVCVWDTTLVSKDSLAYSQLGLYKADAQYTQISHRFGKVPFQIIIGTIVNTTAVLQNSGFTYQGEKGSDFLMQY